MQFVDQNLCVISTDVGLIFLIFGFNLGMIYFLGFHFVLRLNYRIRQEFCHFAFKYGASVKTVQTGPK